MEEEVHTASVIVIFTQQDLARTTPFEDPWGLALGPVVVCTRHLTTLSLVDVVAVVGMILVRHQEPDMTPLDLVLHPLAATEDRLEGPREVLVEALVAISSKSIGAPLSHQVGR
jgi:hypothetical protein